MCIWLSILFIKITQFFSDERRAKEAKLSKLRDGRYVSARKSRDRKSKEPKRRTKKKRRHHHRGKHSRRHHHKHRKSSENSGSKEWEQVPPRSRKHQSRGSEAMSTSQHMQLKECASKYRAVYGTARRRSTQSNASSQLQELNSSSAKYSTKGNQAKKAHQKTEKTLKKSNESSTPAASAASVNASTKRKKRVEKPKRQHANDYDNLDPDEMPQDKDEGNNEGKHAQNNKKNAANAKTPQKWDEKKVTNEGGKSKWV
ncbi:hypothetical protein Tcan_14040 [Toxocara canis]|uniref:Uncharacterized protein n=1 Tax=Toxocara canis TaxID=6265 RepID=A0A0B2VAQ0_TOXCA|nr:hypothetical protein Tcan_14040 [Toxocara canis]